MAQKVGIVYASVDGQTKKICEQLATVLRQEGVITELYSIASFGNDFSRFNTLIVGASIRYGKHNKNVLDFFINHKTQLRNIQTAFFSVNLVARKSNKNSVHTNPYLIKFLKQIKWQPDVVDVFAGKLDYKSYAFLDRLMIKLIMKLTNGPTTSPSPIEFTDWDKVKRFGLTIAKTCKTL